MSAIDFAVADVQPKPYAAVPTLVATLRASAPEGETIHSIALRCQIRIEPQRRRYARRARSSSSSPASRARIRSRAARAGSCSTPTASIRRWCSRS